MANELMTNETLITALAAETKMTRGGDYNVVLPASGAQTVLKRDVDFGKFGRAARPSLLKSGAEKICMAYGVMPRHDLVQIGEVLEGDDPYFSYTDKCELIKLGKDGKEYVFSSAYGAANTKEKRCGFSGAFDSQNSTIKMAQKRALVAAALAISGLSAMFTQDIEDDSVSKTYDEMVEAAQKDRPTAKQVKRLYAIAASAGFSGDKTKKEILARFNVEKVTEMSQNLYEQVCDYFAHYGESEVIDGNA